MSKGIALKALAVAVFSILLLTGAAFAAQVNWLADHEDPVGSSWGGNAAAYPAADKFNNVTGVPVWDGSYNSVLGEHGRKFTHAGVMIGSCSYMRGMGDILGSNLTYPFNDVWFEWSPDNITWSNFTDGLIVGNSSDMNDTRAGYGLGGANSYWTLINFTGQETLMSIKMVTTTAAAAAATEEWECYEAGALAPPAGAEPRANITFDDLEGTGDGGLTCPFTTNAASYNYSATPFWNHTDVPTNLDLYINATYYITNGTLLKNATQHGAVVNYAALNDNDYDLFFRAFMNTTGAYYTGNCTATSDRVLPNITAFSPTNGSAITAASLELAIYQEDTHLHNFTYCISNTTLGTGCLAYNTSILDGNITWDTNDTTTNFTGGGTYWVNYTVCDDVNCVTEDIIFEYTVATQLGVSMLEDLTSQHSPQAVIAEYESDQGTANLSKWTIATANATWTDRYGHEAQSFDGKMWVMGGVNDSAAPKWLNDIWSSVDGVTWTAETFKAPWGTRQIFGSAVFDDKLFIFGGQNDSGYMNDVWSSFDGINWVRVNGSAAFTPRGNFESLVFDNKIWIIAGENGSGKQQDVWYTSDGALWYPATYNATFRERFTFGSTVHQSKMWIFGGSSLEVMADVWSSPDGVTWTRATENAAWLNRTNPEVVTLGGKMWLSGGQIGIPFARDIWSSIDGAVWTLEKESAEFQNRTYHKMFTHAGRMWLTGGRNETYMSDVWYSTETISAAIAGATCNATSADGEGPGEQAMTYEAHFGRYQLNFTENLTDGSVSRWTVQCSKPGYEYQIDQVNDTVDHWHPPVDAESFIASGVSDSIFTGLFMDYSRMGTDNPAESNVTGPTKCTLFKAEASANATDPVKFVSGWKGLHNASFATLFLHPATAGVDGTGTGRYPNPSVNISSCTLTKPNSDLSEYATCESNLEVAIGKGGYYYVCARTWGASDSMGLAYGNESSTGASIFNVTLAGRGTEWWFLTVETALAVITMESANITSVVTPGYACVAGNVTGQMWDGTPPLQGIQVDMESSTGVTLATDTTNAIGEYQVCLSEQQSNTTSISIYAHGNATWSDGCWGGTECGSLVIENGSSYDNINIVLVPRGEVGVDVTMWMDSTFEDQLQIDSYHLNRTTRANQTVYQISYAITAEGSSAQIPDDAIIETSVHSTCYNSTPSEIGSSDSYQSRYNGGKWELEYVSTIAGNTTQLWWQCLDNDYIKISLWSESPWFRYINMSEYRFEFANMEVDNPSLTPRDGDMNPWNYTWLSLRFGLIDAEDGSPISNATCYGEILQPDGTPFTGIGPAWPQMSNTTTGYYNMSQNISFGNGTSFQWAANCTIPGYNDLNFTSGYGGRLTVSQGYFDVVDCFARADGAFVRNLVQEDKYVQYRCVLSTFSLNASYDNMDIAPYVIYFVHVGSNAILTYDSTTSGNYTFNWWGRNEFTRGSHHIVMIVDGVNESLYLDNNQLEFDVEVRDWTYEPAKNDFFMTPQVSRGDTLVCMAELLFDGTFSYVRAELTVLQGNTEEKVYEFDPGVFSTVIGPLPSLDEVEQGYATGEALYDFIDDETHRVAYVAPNIAAAYPNRWGLANNTRNLQCNIFVEYGGMNELAIDTMFGEYMGDTSGDFDWFGLLPWWAGLTARCQFSGPEDILSCDGVEDYLYESIVDFVQFIISIITGLLFGEQAFERILIGLAGLVMFGILFLAIFRGKIFSSGAGP